MKQMTNINQNHLLFFLIKINPAPKFCSWQHEPSLSRSLLLRILSIKYNTCLLPYLDVARRSLTAPCKLGGTKTSSMM